LSFSVIILNTSLHNPSVKEKPTLDKFIAMNRGINDGKDIPRDIQEVNFFSHHPFFFFSFFLFFVFGDVHITDSPFSFSFFRQSIYDSIKAEPFKIPEDDGNDLMHTFFNPDREGWLWKQGFSAFFFVAVSISYICLLSAMKKVAATNRGRDAGLF
jgi:cytohesin